MTSLLPIVSFWHGPMSWLERLCIQSYLDQGHAFHLFAFEKPEGLPQGAVWHDAEEIMPRAQLVFYKGKGTPAVFSDRFRLALMRQSRGIWSDCDVYCVRPLADLGDTILSYEREPSLFEPQGSINGAVMLLPPRSPLLDDLEEVFSPSRRRLLEPHLPFFRRIEVALRRLLGSEVPPEFMQYGATCPFALTHFVPRRGLLGRVLPRPAFYPVPYARIPRLLEAGSAIDEFVTPQTFGVHIWRSQLTNRGRAELLPPPPHSALWSLCQKHGIATR